MTTIKRPSSHMHIWRN